MLGHPKYDYEDKVKFKIILPDETEEVEMIGSVYIIDAYGTFFQNEEPSYDVMVEKFTDGKKCLVKHIRESRLTKVEM